MGSTMVTTCTEVAAAISARLLRWDKMGRWMWRHVHRTQVTITPLLCVLTPQSWPTAGWVPARWRCCWESSCLPHCREPVWTKTSPNICMKTWPFLSSHYGWIHTVMVFLFTDLRLVLLFFGSFLHTTQRAWSLLSESDTLKNRQKY